MHGRMDIIPHRRIRTPGDLDSRATLDTHAYRVCEPRTRPYHRVKTYLIRTNFAHDTGSAARALGSQLPASCSAASSTLLLHRSGARPRWPRSTRRAAWRSIGRARSAACRVRGRRSSHPAPRRCEATSATQAQLEALDGAGVVSVGPAGVITSSWRCSARAERRAAADRTGLLHARRAAPRAPRLHGAVGGRSVGGQP